MIGQLLGRGSSKLMMVWSLGENLPRSPTGKALVIVISLVVHRASAVPAARARATRAAASAVRRLSCAMPHGGGGNLFHDHVSRVEIVRSAIVPASPAKCKRNFKLASTETLHLLF